MASFLPDIQRKSREASTVIVYLSYAYCELSQRISYALQVSTNLDTRSFVHQASPELKGFTLSGCSKSTLYPIDRHYVTDSARLRPQPRRFPRVGPAEKSPEAD